MHCYISSSLDKRDAVQLSGGDGVVGMPTRATCSRGALRVITGLPPLGLMDDIITNANRNFYISTMKASRPKKRRRLQRLFRKVLKGIYEAIKGI
jgi:hypothetical protein